MVAATLVTTSSKGKRRLDLKYPPPPMCCMGLNILTLASLDYDELNRLNGPGLVG